MKCKNCGAPLTITQRFCDNCGAPNEQSKEHIEAMERYKKTFGQTKMEVEKNSRWFMDYLVPLTVLVLALIAAVFFVIADNSLLSYRIADSQNKSYIKKNQTEIDAHLKTLLENKEYDALLEARNCGRKLTCEGDAYGYSTFYNVLDYYESIRVYMTAYFDAARSDDYRRDSAIPKTAENIFYIYDTLKRQAITNESKPYVEDVKEEMELFIRAYCHLTEEDIKKLPDMDQVAVLSLLTRRMSDEEN